MRPDSDGDVAPELSLLVRLSSKGYIQDYLSAQGMGKADPVADNSTAAGRKLNRRVEMIVSGDVIGTQLTPGAVDNTPANPR